MRGELLLGMCPGKAIESQAGVRRQEMGPCALGSWEPACHWHRKYILGIEMGLNGDKTRSAFEFFSDMLSEVIKCVCAGYEGWF